MCGWMILIVQLIDAAKFTANFAAALSSALSNIISLLALILFHGAPTMAVVIRDALQSDERILFLNPQIPTIIPNRLKLHRSIYA